MYPEPDAALQVTLCGSLDLQRKCLDVEITSGAEFSGVPCLGCGVRLKTGSCELAGAAQGAAIPRTALADNANICHRFRAGVPRQRRQYARHGVLRRSRCLGVLQQRNGRTDGYSVIRANSLMRRQPPPQYR